jgi:hypothetical protein
MLALSGKFDPDALEAALDAYALEGWRVVQGCTAASLWKRLKTEIVVIRSGTPATRAPNADHRSARVLGAASVRTAKHRDDGERKATDPDNDERAPHCAGNGARLALRSVGDREDLLGLAENTLHLCDRLLEVLDPLADTRHGRLLRAGRGSLVP